MIFGYTLFGLAVLGALLCVITAFVFWLMDAYRYDGKERIANLGLAFIVCVLIAGFLAEFLFGSGFGGYFILSEVAP